MMPRPRPQQGHPARVAFWVGGHVRGTIGKRPCYVIVMFVLENGWSGLAWSQQLHQRQDGCAGEG